MRCLHCGKELALLTRLTRGGEFCSEAHKRSYHEEYNSIALSRLLQAQAKPVPVKPAPVQAAEPKDEPPRSAAPAMVEEKAAVAVETPVAVAEVEDEKPEEALEATETAGFILAGKTVPVSGEAPPYLEPYLESWQPSVQPPAAPKWHFEGRAEPALPEAQILPLPFRPDFSSNEHPAPEVKVTPNEFVPRKANPPTVRVTLASNTLPAAGPIYLSVAPTILEYSPVAVLDGILEFSGEVEFRASVLLQLFPSEIAFPPEDADVTVVSPESGGSVLEQPGEASVEQIGADAAESRPENAKPSEAASPSAALEALAKLHQELMEHAEAAAEVAAAAPVEELVGAAPVEEAVGAPPVEEVVAAVPVEQIVAAAPVEEVVAAATVEEVVAETPVEEAVAAEPIEAAVTPVVVQATVPSAPEMVETAKVEHDGVPRKTGEFVEIPVKSFAPPKPVPIEGGGAHPEALAFLPRLTGLPLRPKIGLASPQTAQSLKAGQSKSAAPDAKSKAAATPAGEPTDVPEKTSPKTDKPGPAELEAAAKSEPMKSATASAWQKPQPASAAADKAKAATPAPVSKSGKQASGVSSKPKLPDKVQATASAAKQPIESKPAQAETPEAAFSESAAPMFGTVQLRNSSWIGSFKVKIAIATAVLAISGIAYFAFGGKSRGPSASPAAAVDKPGPSIMVGGGGWMEGWAGDPVGGHFGRQITLYRPSLKLSDYRIDFQGQIETKSMGWVFRASNPQNYYAMKLTIVTSGLEPKIALFKYLVANGRQTQVGRVPIDQPVRLDTLYRVRVDVQGPRFSTYVQGQQADIWTDDQLKSGGVGFLNEREERGRIKSVSVSLLNGGKQ